jgi:hypothetical protein
VLIGAMLLLPLMMPIVSLGFEIATLNWTVFAGSLLLFVANPITIALPAALMARIPAWCAPVAAAYRVAAAAVLRCTWPAFDRVRRDLTPNSVRDGCPTSASRCDQCAAPLTRHAWGSFASLKHVSAQTIALVQQ